MLPGLNFPKPNFLNFIGNFFIDQDAICKKNEQKSLVFCIRKTRHRAFSAARRAGKKIPIAFVQNTASVNIKRPATAVLVISTADVVVVKVFKNKILKQGQVFAGNDRCFDVYLARLPGLDPSFRKVSSRTRLKSPSCKQL